MAYTGSSPVSRGFLRLSAGLSVACHSGHAFLPGTMTTGSAAWEARPPGPDSWAGSAVRRIIAPVTMAATGARAAGGCTLECK